MQNVANGTCPHKDIVLRLEKDMYFGNGKPGMTTRMAAQETITEQIASSLKWIVRLLVGTFLSGIAGIIVALVVGHR